MAVLPKGSDHESGTMAPDGARDDSSIFRGVYQPTVRQVQRLASCAKEFGCRRGLYLPFFERPSRAHFAVRQVYYGERNPRVPQEEGDTPGAPLHIVRMSTKEEYVYGHKRPWYQPSSASGL